MDPLTLFAIALSTTTPSDSSRMKMQIEPEAPVIVRDFQPATADKQFVHAVTDQQPLKD